jgi:hypothetical protein
MMAVRKDLPNRNTGRNTLMLDQLSPKLRPGESFSQVNPACPQRPRTAEVMAGTGFSALGTTFATRNPGAGEDFTDLAAAVQLRLRVAILLGSPSRVANFGSEIPALNRREVLAHGHQARFRGNPPSCRCDSAATAVPLCGINCRALPHESASLSIGPNECPAPAAPVSRDLGSPLMPRGPIWNVNWTGEPGFSANECVPSGKW